MKGMESQAVLVLDADQRSALAAVRSLGRTGSLKVHAADSGPSSLAGSSRFCAGHVTIPSPLQSPARYPAAVAEAARAVQASIVFPMTDASLMLLAPGGAQLADVTVAGPPAAAYEALTDKAQLVCRAKELGILVPETFVTHNLPEVRSAVARVGVPAVLKPARSQVLLDGRIVSTSVRVARSEHDLDAVAASPWFGRIPCLVQQHIAGSGAGVFALCGTRGPIAWFAHCRIREKPPSGGVSVLSESVPVSPELRRQAERLLTDVGWFGPAMVEFRVDAQGRAWLMEVNGRFWGSLQLAIDCGVDFPWLLYQACTGHDTNGPEQYENGRRLRWLLGDLDHLLLQLRGKGTAPTVAQKVQALIAFATALDRRTHLEVYRKDDREPFWHELKGWLRGIAG